MNIAFAPSIPWLPERLNHIEGTAPNPFLLERQLKKMGIESIIIDPNKKPWNPFSGKSTLLQSIDPIRALKICRLSRHIDIVVSVFEGAAASLSLLRPFLNKNTKIVLWDIGLTDWRLRNEIINFTLPRIDHLMVLGTNQLDYVNKNYRPCKSASAVGHLLDTDFYTPTPLNLAGPILSVGDDIGRDFHTLHSAMTGIERKLVIKASRHPPELNGDHVQVIRERISHLQLRQLYTDASIVVVPTRATANACGVSSILEAAASQRPLVVTDNPGIRDFVVPGETCLLIPEGDAGAMRRAIQELLRNPELSEQLAQNARQFVLENCSIPAFANRFANTLKALQTGHD